MPYEFKLIHRVEFAETDMAGIVHFANFYRWMENTEHAFFRSMGFSIHAEYEGRMVGWPRVHASCEYRSPARFEEEVEIHLRVTEKRPKSLGYQFIFRKLESGVGKTEIARGKITAVCVALDPAQGRMRAVTIPAAIAAAIEIAPSESGAGE